MYSVGLMVMDQTAATRPAQSGDDGPDDRYAAVLEFATRGLLALNVVVLEQVEKRIGLAPLRALQSLQRLGPTLVTELGDDLGLVPSTASRLSDRLADSGLITRAVSPRNRRATILDLTEAGCLILDDLVEQRVGLIGAVAEQMTAAERDALLQGAAAFTAAYHRVTEHQGLAADPAPNSG